MKIGSVKPRFFRHKIPCIEIACCRSTEVDIAYRKRFKHVVKAHGVQVQCEHIVRIIRHHTAYLYKLPRPSYIDIIHMNLSMSDIHRCRLHHPCSIVYHKMALLYSDIHIYSAEFTLFKKR